MTYFFITSLQQKLKCQKEQDEFNRKKRHHELQLVDMEQKEVKRREEEIKQKKEDLENKRNKHKQIEDAIILQNIICKKCRI